MDTHDLGIPIPRFPHGYPQGVIPEGPEGGCRDRGRVEVVMMPRL